jgi:hypothetical protein
MKKLSAALLVGAAVLVSTPAFGQATRTWVSGVGDDVNPCSRTAPCKTFAGAISKTAAGGEISVLDPGGFGGVTITKSMTIDGLGPMSSILAVGQNGVLINGAGINVILRNLTINCAASTVGNGIRIINAATVVIDNVTIENCAGTGTNGRGIVIDSSAANTRVYVQNSRLANLANFGIDANPTAGNVLLTVDNVQFNAIAQTAILLRLNTTATINRASVTRGGNAAVTLQQTTTGAHISNSLFANNVFGLFNGDAGGAPITRLYQTVITGSSTSALQINGGQVISYGNNAIRGNSGNEAPSSNSGTQ